MASSVIICIMDFLINLLVLSSNPVCLFIIIIISLYAFAVALMYFLHLKEKELMSLSS